MNTEYDLIENLFEGTIGNIIEIVNDQLHSSVFGNVTVFDGEFYNNGQLLIMDDGVCEIEQFEFTEDKLWLLYEDGYRGDGCYYGVMEKDDQLFLFDIVSDCMVYKLIVE